MGFVESFGADFQFLNEEDAEWPEFGRGGKDVSCIDEKKISKNKKI